MATLLVGLECHWKMDEASGATRLDSHGVEHLLNNGTVGQAAGKLGNAATFDGNAANYLSKNTGTDPNLNGGDVDYSFNAWIYLDAKTAPEIILAKGSVDYLLFYFNGDDRFHFDAGNGAAAIGTAIANTFGSPSAGEWIMLSAGHSAATNRVWISVNGGAKDYAATTGPGGSSATGLEVGRWGGAFSYDGRIDSVDFWKKEVSAAELTTLYNGGAALEWPFLGGAALYATVDAVDSGGVDIRVLVPGNHAVGASYPLVLYHHGLGEDYTAVTVDVLKQGVVRNLLGNGYIVAGSSQHGDSWGNDASLTDMVNLYNYLNTNYVLSERTVHFGQSAGGPSSLLCTAGSIVAVPDTLGWFGVYPACDLAWCYAQPGFTASIEAAYGIDGTPYGVATLGHDPVLLAAALFTGLRMRFYASAADATVTKADNTDVMQALVAGTATESDIIVATGAHGDPSHFRPTDVSAFCGRCV